MLFDYRVTVIKLETSSYVSIYHIAFISTTQIYSLPEKKKKVCDRVCSVCIVLNVWLKVLCLNFKKKLCSSLNFRGKILRLKCPKVWDTQMKRPKLSNFEVQERGITTYELNWGLHSKECSLCSLEYSFLSSSSNGREKLFPVLLALFKCLRNRISFVS